MGYNVLPSFMNRSKTNRQLIGGIATSLDAVWDMLNVEIKHHDVNPFNDASLGITPTFQPLTEIQQGITGGSPDSIDTGYRDGDKIRVKTINLKIKLENITTSATQVNFMLVKHYDNYSGQGPLFTELYDANTGTDLSIRLRRPEFNKTYKILASRQLMVSGDQSENQDKYINIYHKNAKRVGSFIEWESAQSSGISNGKYYLLFWADAASTVSASLSGRTTYVDN